MKQKGVMGSHHHLKKQAFELNKLMFDSCSVKSTTAGKTESCAHRVSRSKGESCPDLQKNCCSRFSSLLGASLPILRYDLLRFLCP